MGLLPLQAQTPPPLQGMVCACITNLPLLAPENLLQANVIRFVSTHSEGHCQFGVATFCVYKLLIVLYCMEGEDILTLC